MAAGDCGGQGRLERGDNSLRGAGVGGGAEREGRRAKRALASRARGGGNEEEMEEITAWMRQSEQLEASARCKQMVQARGSVGGGMAHAAIR